jgi:hypothetical protein
MISNDAITVTLDQVRSLLGDLGVEPDTSDLRSVHIDPGVITVTRFRKNEEGRMVVLPGTSDVATVTTTIAVVA